MHLRQHAKEVLAQQNLSETPTVILDQNNNRSEDNMKVLTVQERIIFKAVYYQERSIACIAESLGEEENSIRIQLKSSIDKMRRLREN